jgi:hypothetical protein
MPTLDEMVRSKRPTGADVLSLVVIVVASVALTWAWGALGDYPNDGGPPIADFLGGHLTAFFHHEPAMGSLALFLRLPFAALAFLGSPTPRTIYLYGCVPCVVSVGLLGMALARVARSQGTGVVGQLAIVAVCLVNPLVRNALALGHPEELLTASLAVGAVVAARERRQLPAAILLGLALATKQWAVVFVLPVLLLGAGRRRTLGVALAVASAVSLPLFAGSPTDFLKTQIGLAHMQFLEPASDSWWYPIAPSVRVPIVLDGHPAVVSLARLSPDVAGLLHPLILGLAALLATALWRRRRGRPSSDEVFALMALILLLRCTLDTETMPYYHAALLLTLLAWDALDGGRIPTRALAASGAAWLLGRVSSSGDPAVFSGCYAAVTLVGAGLLIGLLTHASGGEPKRLVPAPQAAGGT